MIQIEQRSVGTNWCHSDEGETPAPSEIADYTKLMISICSLNLATICWQLSIVIQPLQPWLMTRTLRGKQAGVCWPLPPQAPIYRKGHKNWANAGSVFCSFDMLWGSMLVLKRNENWITSKEKIVPEDLGVSMTNICCIVFSITPLSLFWFSFHIEWFSLNTKFTCLVSPALAMWHSDNHGWLGWQMSSEQGWIKNKIYRMLPSHRKTCGTTT